MIDELRDVFGSFPERGHAHLDHVDAIVQIFAEFAVGHHLRQIAIGREQHARVDLFFTAAADGTHLALLQDAQQASLHLERHLADFVEQEGAALAIAEQPFAIAVGAREGALHVAEQLALQQVLGDGTAIDAQRARLGTRRGGVDGTRHDFLTRAALARDQHGHVRVAHAIDQRVHAAHGFARTDQALIAEVAVQRVPGVA